MRGDASLNPDMFKQPLQWDPSTLNPIPLAATLLAAAVLARMDAKLKSELLTCIGKSDKS